MTEKKKPKLNVRLLERVAKHIEREPTRLEMGDWIGKSRESPCGTQACIAGWAMILSKPAAERERLFKSRAPLSRACPSGDFDGEGVKLLGLSSAQASRLFYSGNWPRKFHRALHKADGLFNEGNDGEARKVEATAAAARIRHMIETGR